MSVSKFADEILPVRFSECLAVTYGLRAGEVVKLRLEALDWRRDRIDIFIPRPPEHYTIGLVPRISSQTRGKELEV